MNILIVGLGLIGGSYAMGLSKAGHHVYGLDKNQDVIDYAYQKKYIINNQNDYSLISQVDLVILAIYPMQILEFLKENNHYFKSNQFVTDVCGVKSSFVNEALLLARPATYVSHHPMAGKEKVGIEYADAAIFKNANFLITPVDTTDRGANGIEVLKNIAIDLGFGRISVVSPAVHDKMIGFTSELTHAIAVSLVNSDKDLETVKYIGDSYRDLTRIAMINETLWSELFLENKDYLLEHIDNFLIEIEKIRLALKNNDRANLNQLFKKSTEKRKEMEK